MDERILVHLKDLDQIWHAGDIGDLKVTDQLAEVADLKAVYGNIDDHQVRATFPLDLHFEIEGLKVYMTHIAGRPGKYPERVWKQVRAEKPGLIVCGHSHICLVGKVPGTDMLHINPGAAGRHGFHQKRTLIRMHVDQGLISNLEVVELGPR